MDGCGHEDTQSDVCIYKCLIFQHLHARALRRLGPPALDVDGDTTLDPADRIESQSRRISMVASPRRFNAINYSRTREHLRDATIVASGRDPSLDCIR